MRNKRFFFGICALFVLVLMLIGAAAFFGVQQLSKQSSKLQSIKAEEATVEKQKASQTQAKKDIAKYSELNNLTKSIVPQDKDQAKTVREINNIASQSGVSLKSVTFNSSTLGQIKAAPSSGTSGTSGTKTQATPSITQVKPVDGIPGVYALEIVIANDEDSLITYNQLINFLSKLESNRRTAHVDKISITPKKGGKLSFSITLNAYVKP